MENLWLILLVLVAFVVLGYLVLGGSSSSVGDKTDLVSFEYAPQVEQPEEETVVPYDIPAAPPADQNL